MATTVVDLTTCSSEDDVAESSSVRSRQPRVELVGTSSRTQRVQDDYYASIGSRSGTNIGTQLLTCVEDKTRGARHRKKRPNSIGRREEVEYDSMACFIVDDDEEDSDYAPSDDYLRNSKVVELGHGCLQEGKRSNKRRKARAPPRDRRTLRLKNSTVRKTSPSALPRPGDAMSDIMFANFLRHQEPSDFSASRSSTHGRRGGMTFESAVAGSRDGVLYSMSSSDRSRYSGFARGGSSRDSGYTGSYTVGSMSTLPDRDFGPDDYERLLALDKNNVNVGFTAIEISRLPSCQVTASALVPSSPGCEAPMCCICQEEYILCDKQLILPCLHKFHEDCITPWLSNKRTCPMCMNRVEL